MGNEVFNRLISGIRNCKVPPRLIAALEAGQTHYHALPYCEMLCKIPIILKEGHGPQSMDKRVDTSFTEYLRSVVNPSVEAFKKTNPGHPFDDRKFRLDHFYLEEGESKTSLTLKLGPTEYRRYQQDIKRSRHQAVELMGRGVRDAANPYYYFSKTLGLTVVLLSSEGYTFLGERPPHIDYPGYIHMVGGLATFHSDLSRVDFTSDIKTEIEEELGLILPDSSVNFQFIGIAGNVFSSEMDLVFVFKTGMAANDFRQMPLTEHIKMIEIRDKKEALNLIENDLLPGRDQEKNAKKMIFSARFAMEYLLENHF